MTLKEGIKIALSILKQVMKDKITCNNIDVATVTETGYKLFSDAEVEESLHLLDSLVCCSDYDRSVCSEKRRKGNGQQIC